MRAFFTKSSSFYASSKICFKSTPEELEKKKKRKKEMTSSELHGDNASRGIPAVKQYKEILLHVFAKTGYDYKQDFVSEDVELRKALEDAFDLDNLSVTARQAISNGFQVGYDFANLVFHHASADIKFLVGKYVILGVYTADDTAPDRMVLLQQFTEKFVSNEPQGEVYLDAFARLLSHDIRNHYGPFATSCIIKNCLEFLGSSALEHQYPNGFRATSEQFPNWLRRKTGNGETYAFFLFPEATFPEHRLLSDFLAAIPDMAEWINLTNDVLSYYKERVVGREDNCYIVNDAVMLGVTEMEALEASVRYLGVLHDRVVAVLSPKEELLASWKNLERGFIMFHLKQERYKLNDLF